MKPKYKVGQKIRTNILRKVKCFLVAQIKKDYYILQVLDEACPDNYGFREASFTEVDAWTDCYIELDTAKIWREVLNE